MSWHFYFWTTCRLYEPLVSCGQFLVLLSLPEILFFALANRIRQVHAGIPSLEAGDEAIVTKTDSEGSLSWVVKTSM